MRSSGFAQRIFMMLNVYDVWEFGIIAFKMVGFAFLFFNHVVFFLLLSFCCRRSSIRLVMANRHLFVPAILWPIGIVTRIPSTRSTNLITWMKRTTKKKNEKRIKQLKYCIKHCSINYLQGAPHWRTPHNLTLCVHRTQKFIASVDGMEKKFLMRSTPHTQLINV